MRDYNDMICGICGVVPKLEIAQRHTDTVLELKHVEVTDCVRKSHLINANKCFGVTTDDLLYRP